VTAKLQQVHVRVNDAATGKPTPCRIAFKDAEGNYLAPHGRTPNLPAGIWLWYCRRYLEGTLPPSDDPSAYIDGECEILLPPGRLSVAIHKGTEYEPIYQSFDLPQGKLSLRYELNRVVDPESQGCFSGAIVRAPLTPHQALLEAAAEGLNVVDLLAYERETTNEGREPAVERSELDPDLNDEPLPADRQPTIVDFPNLLAFSGQRPCLENAECLVAVNTYNAHNTLGDLALLNCHRVVYPLRFGRSAHFPWTGVDKPDDWTLADWSDQCHRKGGLVVSKAHFRNDDGAWRGGEALADLVLGKIDALALEFEYERHWYPLLSLGLQIPLVATVGRVRPIGKRRTYAWLEPGQPLSYANWTGAVRKGRTAVSRGPLLSLTVAGAMPGSVVDTSEAELLIQAEAKDRDAFDRIEVILDGKVIHEAAAKHEAIYKSHVEFAYPVSRSGWVAARCMCRGQDGGDWPVAHTSAVYLRVPRKPAVADPQVAQGIAAHFDRMLAWVETQARCETPKQRERLANVFLQAKQKLASL
jgi:hypothetical protein